MSITGKIMGSLASRKFWIFLSLMICLGLAPGWPLQLPVKAQTPPPKEDYPLNITAARLEADHPQQLITFSGQVVARHRDMILYADVLKIFYQTQKPPPTPGDKGQVEKTAAPEAESPLAAVGIEKISKIVAQGHVRLVQQDKVASGDKAIYYKDQEKIVLLGHPQLWRGENSLTGERITFYLKDNRAVIVGAPKRRVEAIIYPAAKSPVPKRSGQ
jgi:lipopolysaccharide export system protein LptA